MIVTIDIGWRTESVTPGTPLSAPKRPCTAMSESGEIRWMADLLLGMELPVLLVVMHGVADLGIHVDIAQAVEDLDDLAMALAPVPEERKAQPIAERRRIGDRGNVALATCERGSIVFLQELRSGTDAVRLVD